MMSTLSRRTWLAAATTLAATPKVHAQPTQETSFKYCLNTSTIRLAESQWGKPRPIIESIKIASQAGYQAIEPWISELDEYVQGGGTLKDLSKIIADAGLIVPDAIGFAEWIVDDKERRAKGLEQARRDMQKVSEIGGTHIAAPPVGATGGGSRRDDPNNSRPVDSLMAAERYRDLLAIGHKMGVTPIVEVWGFSKSLSRLGECWLVAAECGKTGGCVLPDIYHLYKGGSGLSGLGLMSASAIGIFHVNDYPAIDRSKIVDQDRVYPGDGVADLVSVFRTLRHINYSGYLSLELFNRGYWQNDPLTVAKTGLSKMKAIAERVG